MPLWNNWWQPVCFQCPRWSPSGLPVCSNYASNRWIATGTPWRSSTNQCGSSGIPVYLWPQWYSNMFNYANELLIATGIPIGDITSQCGSMVVCPSESQCTHSIWFGGQQVGLHPSMQSLCVQLVRRELLELS